MQTSVPPLIELYKKNEDTEVLKAIASFSDPAIAKNAYVRLIAPAHGGHCAFISRHGGENRFWAEGCVMEFCRELSTASPDRNDIHQPPRL